MVSSTPAFLNLLTSVARKVEEKVAQFLKGSKSPTSNLFLNPIRPTVKGMRILVQVQYTVGMRILVQVQYTVAI